jgi:hypothetical protein
MFYFRLNKVRILDNREKGGLFRPDRAEIEFLSLINTGNDDFPNVDALLHTEKSEEHEAVLTAIITQIASSRVIRTIYDVKDGQVFTFGDAGYTLFQTKKIPQDFNWIFLAIEKDDEERELGQDIQAVLQHPEYPAFRQNVLTVIRGATNPAFVVGIEAARFMAKVWLDRLAHSKDKQAGVLYMSLNRPEHYRHGLRDKQDVSDLTGNMFVDYTIFGTR